MAEHQYQEIKARPVALVPHPSLPDDSPPYIVPLGEEVTVIGCTLCGMGQLEASEKQCPGQPARPKLVELTEA